MNFDSPPVYLFRIYWSDGAQPEIRNSAAATAIVIIVKRKDRIMLFSFEFDSKHEDNIIWSGQLFHRLFRFCNGRFTSNYLLAKLKVRIGSFMETPANPVLPSPFGKFSVCFHR